TPSLSGVDRKDDLEGRSHADLARHRDVAATLLDDAIDGGEAETGPLPALLRGEERLEDALAGRFIHSAAGVGHPQQDGGARDFRVRRHECAAATGGL